MSLRRDLVVLLVIDVLFLILMELLLKEIPAPFPIFVKIGNLLVTLAVSFLASFVFYFVQVHMPQVRQERDLYPIISRLFNRIIQTEKSLLTNFVNEKSYSTLTEDIIRNGTKNRDVNMQNAPLIFAGSNRNANWIEYGYNQVVDIDNNWNMIMRYSAHLDSEQLLILSKIQSNSVLNFFRKMKVIYGSLNKQIELKGFDNGVVEFWNEIKLQEDFYKRTFSEYDD